ncbi:MAG: ABC transporter permease [Rhizobiaceae bacterium]
MPDQALPIANSKWRDQFILFAPFGALLLYMFLTLLPVGALVWIAAHASLDVWPHLARYVLPTALWDTALLLLLVAVGTIILGAGCAWMTSLCDFPGRKFFSWALVLPLAVPTYIAAYTHVEFFEYSGPIQSAVRSLGDFSSGADYWFPDIRSLGGAGFVFSFVLYPYVYLSTRLVFSMQGASALDVSRTLGAGQFEIFRRVALPMARPALAAGAALALMETLNDIGAVEFLGVKTLTYAVFETWLNRNSLAGAVQLSLLTLIIIGALVLVERRSRQKRSYATSTRERPPSLLKLSPLKQVMCFIACFTPLLLGLGVPLWVLGVFALRRLDDVVSTAVLQAAGNSILVASSTAVLATLIAYLVLQFGRLSGVKSIATTGRIAGLGYAIPGTVLALGLLVPLAGFDNWFDGLMRQNFEISTGLMISGSVLVIIYACTLRFMAISYGTIEAGFLRITPNIDMAARALGRNSREIAWQVHRPILGKALAVAFLLVFVDTMKELSATLLLRPFDFETLSTFVYDRASQSALEDAAIASIVIVLIGIIPAHFLSRLSNTKKTRTLLPAKKG